MRFETFSTPEPPSLRINLPSGAIRIETSESDQTHVEIDGPNEDEARIEYRRGEVVIEIERRKSFGLSRDHQLFISAPLGTRVDSESASADVEGRGRFGDVAANSASGDVFFENVDGRVEVNTASGDVRVDFVGGDLRVNSASGDIRVGEADHDARIRTASGDVEIRSAAQGKIDIQSASGEIAVGVRRGSKVYIDASSMSGDTTSELELSDTPSDSEGPSVDFRARTMSGDITVRRAS
jgi:DUF4097 and DUF4098 domain-containing protein YvlB